MLMSITKMVKDREKVKAKVSMCGLELHSSYNDSSSVRMMFPCLNLATRPTVTTSYTLEFPVFIFFKFIYDKYMFSVTILH